MRIAYAYHRDAGNPAIQSGRPFSLLQQLRAAGAEVDEIFPLVENTRWARRAHKIVRKLMGRESLLDRHEPLLRSFAHQIEERLAGSNAEAVFCPGTLPLSYLETSLPITFCADAPLAAMLGYYGSFTKLSTAQRDLAETLEADVLRRTSLAVYPSRWAAQAAIEHYRISPEAVAVIPFGANVGAANTRSQVEAAISERSDETIQLLFIGREWARKGGDIVLETVQLLRRQGLKIQLHVVGCRPAGVDSVVQCHGPLNPSHPVERQKLQQLLLSSHLMFVPSRAEAYGMVFCEANAAGVPAITTDTGGISEIIRDGINGYKLPPGAGPRDYASTILEAVASPDHYRALALSSFREFETRLNWRTHCETFLHELKQRIAPAPVTPEWPVEMTLSPDMTPKLRVGYISNTYLDPLLIGSWSGLAYFVRRSMEKHGIEVVPIPLEDGPRKWLIWARFLYYRFIRRQRYLRDREPGLLRHYARQITEKTAGVELDFLFCPGTAPLAYLETKIPTAFWSDATFSGMQDFYDSYTNLAPVSIRDGHAADQAALDRATLALYSSDWAASHAMVRYAADPEKVRVLPFGANLNTDPRREDIETAIDRRPVEGCRLLFVGVDWERKGADCAISVAAALRERGRPAELTIVGCQPPAGVKVPDFVDCVGFVSKGTEEGRQAITRLFSEAHFFLLPTRAEAFGLVFCEANAFGLPAIATRSGGVETIIEHGVNGLLFDLDDPASDFADEILRLMDDPALYRAMALRSRQVFEQRLNWDVSIARLLEMMLARTEPRSLAHA